MIRREHMVIYFKSVCDMKKWYTFSFYYMKDLIVKDNLVKFGIISSHIFPTTAPQISPERSRIVQNFFARSDYDVGVWTHLNIVNKITSILNKLRRLCS